MGKRNWSRDFFRLWVALSLFWIMFLCGAAIVDLVRTLRLPPEPPTFALAEQEADKKCGPSRSLEQIECREEVWFALTDHEMAAEETWRDAYEKRAQPHGFAAINVAVTWSCYCADQARVWSNSAPTKGRLTSYLGGWQAGREKGLRSCARRAT